MGHDKYTCFKDLAAAEKRGEDYDFESRRKDASSVVVIAPHGGKIEPWTDKIADAIAGKDFSFYCFKALKSDRLHIKSHLFDEPTCENLVAAINTWFQLIVGEPKGSGCAWEAATPS